MRLSLLGAIGAWMAIHASVVQADVVTAVNMDGGYTPSGWHISIGYSRPEHGFFNEAAAQEFIPTVSGRLTTLSATVDRFVGGQSLQVIIYAGAGGIPGQYLGMLRVPEEDVVDSGDPEWPLTTVDLSALNIDLVAGQSYFVVFRVDTALYQSLRYRALRTAVNANSFGIRPLYSPDGGRTWRATSFDPEIGLIVSVAGTLPPQEVQIDVAPGERKNSVNLKTKRPKPLWVAVLGDADLDVLDVLPETARFGDPVLTDPELGTGEPVAPTAFDYDDVDGDGDLDLLLQFDVAEMKSAGAVDDTSSLMMLEAELQTGGLIFGFDLINQKTNKGKGHGAR